MLCFTMFGATFLSYLLTTSIKYDTISSIPSNLVRIKIVGIKFSDFDLRRVEICERKDTMKISTKGRYGLRALIDIAIHSSDEPAPLSEIAVRQNISISYLEQLIAKLKKAGIVNSSRGAKGGYTLGRSPDLISVGEVLRTLEGDLNPVACAELTGEGESCSGSELCVTKYVWKRISDSINNTVDTLMLSEIIQENEKILKQHGNTKIRQNQTDCEI